MTSPTSRLPRASTSSRSTTPTSSPRLYSSPHRGSKSHLPQPKVLPFPDLPVRPSFSRNNSSYNASSSNSSSVPSISNGESSRSTAVVGGTPMVAGRSFDGSLSSGEGNRTPTSKFASSPPIPSPLGNTFQIYQSHGLPSGSASTSALPSTSRMMPSPPSALSQSTTTTSNQSPSRTQGFQPVSLSRPIPISTDSNLSSRITTSPLQTTMPSVHPPSPPPTSVQTTAQSPSKSTPIPPVPTKKSSLPTTPASLPASIPITPATSGQPLLDHMYQCFLKGIRADVRLWVREWGVGWMVHSSVLIQAGFFHSLFLGGFSEMSKGSIASSSRKGKARTTGLVQDDDWRGEDIELTFDDPNITRAAFEICLSRLYSPYPHLHFPLSHLPTPASPLTALFSSATPLSSLNSTHRSLNAPTEHLATPHLLLSLLATTIYLGQSSLMREVLAMVLRTVGPGTVVRYLGFAVGDGIGVEEWEGQGAEAARGLEDVGKAVQLVSSYAGKGKGKARSGEGDSEDVDSQSQETDMDDSEDRALVESVIGIHGNQHRGSADSDAKVDDEDLKVGDSSLERPTPSPGLGPAGSSSTNCRSTSHRSSSGDSESTLKPGAAFMMSRSTDKDGSVSRENRELSRTTQHVEDEEVREAREDPTNQDEKLPQFYGFASNKIGEACMCWLARWGHDLLAKEINMSTETGSNPIKIFSYRGLPARFIRALLSSDSLFVPNEMGRYMMTRKVLGLRRRGWENEMEVSGDLSTVSGGEESFVDWEEDEFELGKVFEEGIYYTHMTYDDLATIAADIDPTTSLPYAPLSVLQAAHWAAADLKARITAHERTGSQLSVSSAISPSSDDEIELGLTQTTTEISTAMEKRQKTGSRSRISSPTNSGPSYVLGSISTVRRQFSLDSPSNKSQTYSGLGYGSMNSSAPISNTKYHPVPTDDTHRIGAGGLLFLSPEGLLPASTLPSSAPGASQLSASSSIPSILGLPDLGPELGDYEGAAIADGTGNRKIRPPPQGEATFFGLLGGGKKGEEIWTKWKDETGGWLSPSAGLGEKDNGARGKEERWSKIEPFRFSVEFWGAEKLAEKERAYSATHFYAGSWFNVYVQTIRKSKNVQLGIYLHRQSTNEPFPQPSTPPTQTFSSSSSNKTSSPKVQTSSSLQPPSSSMSRSLSDHVGATSGGGNLDIPPSGNVLPLSTSPGVRSGVVGDNGNSGSTGEVGSRGVSDGGYRDTRKVTKAYFSISCASALGTALIRFSSAPDAFTLSQSWGWKSSALRSEEYLASSVTSSAALSAGVGEKEDLDEGVLGWVGDLNTDEGRPLSLRATVVVGVV